jgi:hypothetical protein
MFDSMRKPEAIVTSEAINSYICANNIGYVAVLTPFADIFYQL